MDRTKQNGLDIGYLKVLSKDVRQSKDGLEKLVSLYFGESQRDPRLSEKTLKYISLLKSGFLRHFYTDQGAGRNFIERGVGDQKGWFEAGSVFIANRTALVNDLRQDSLRNLYDFSQSISFHVPCSIKIKERIEKNSVLFSKRNTTNTLPKKIYTIDISGAKLADLAGEADVLMHKISRELVEGCCEFNQIHTSSKVSVLPFRYGGDEFSLSIEIEGLEPLEKIEKKTWDEIIEKRIKKIRTLFARPNLNNKLSFIEGEVRIKNNCFINDSRPEVLETELSLVRALIYDILLCYANIIPDESNIEIIYDQVVKCNGDTITEKFENYFKASWGQIVERELLIPDFTSKTPDDNDEIIFEISNETLLLHCDELAAKFPGVSILFSIAKKIDSLYERDLNLTQSSHIYLREVANMASKYLFDPVLGTMAYTKHGFDELIKAKQLNGLVVFKEVIKNINDKFGLTKGDAAINQFFEFINTLIPQKLLKHIIFGRGQADIILGFNAQSIQSLSQEDKLEIMSSIHIFFEKIQKIDSFDFKINTQDTQIPFKMNMGVGISRFDSETGYLKPPDFAECFKLTEIDFDVKYVLYILKNNPKQICEDLLKMEDLNVDVIENPNFWNLYNYLNDPKRGANNISRLIFNIKSQMYCFSNLEQESIKEIVGVLEKLKKKVELKSVIVNLTKEINERKLLHSGSVETRGKLTRHTDLEELLQNYHEQLSNFEH